MKSVVVILALLAGACMADPSDSYNNDDDQYRGSYRQKGDFDQGYGDQDEDYESDECKGVWVANDLGNKCYFYSTTLQTFSTFETQAFCNQLGGIVVQPQTQAEYDDAVNFVKKYNGWTDGPLLNIFAPANDSTTIVLGSNFLAPAKALLHTLQAVAQQTTNGTPFVNQCLTFSPDLQIMFGPCNGSNNPFCEKRRRVYDD